LKNILEYILFIGLSYFCRIVGLSLSRKFASVLSFIFYYLIPIRKDVTIDNLKHAFPAYTEKEIKQIAYGSYKSFTIALVEILYLPWMSLEQIKKVVTCNNANYIKKKVEEKNGVILLAAHFGNWEYVAASVAAQIDEKFSVVVKPQRNPYVTKWMNKARTQWTNEVIPLGISIRSIYAVLKEKGIVAMVADQRGPEENIKLEFFGRKTSVLTGPAILSLKTNAPLLYGIPVRQPDFSYITCIEEISKENLPEEFDEKVKELSSRLLKYIEDIIRKYPEQWLWMHKRWKH
jgi:KDO2-lipid IV(A) lauroyltransferase